MSQPNNTPANTWTSIIATGRKPATPSILPAPTAEVTNLEVAMNSLSIANGLPPHPRKQQKFAPKAASPNNQGPKKDGSNVVWKPVTPINRGKGIEKKFQMHINSEPYPISTTTSSTTSGPTKTFCSFTRLPYELRLQIWSHAMTEPRIIELEYGPDRDKETGMSSGTHQWVRVCPRSRAPPSFMRICAESREEASKLWKLRCFDSPSFLEMKTEREIYFNPESDILYFGDDTCISTILHTVVGTSRQPIPRLALNCSGKSEACCDHDDYAYGVGGGISMMQALHGFDASVATSGWTVDVGLNDVIFIVKSNLWPLAAGQIDSTVGMRPATGDGLTKGQVRFKAWMELQIARVEDGNGVHGVGENKWVGENKPNFHFMSLAPKRVGVDSRVYDGMCVGRKMLEKLKARNWEFLRKLEISAGCSIQVAPQAYPTEDPREIGFFGMKDAVEQAKAAIKQKLAHVA